MEAHDVEGTSILAAGDAEEEQHALVQDSASENSEPEAPDQTETEDKFPWEALFPVRETSDFALVIWTRRLCLSGDARRAQVICDRFPFWFGPDTNRLSQVFWTENHMLAVLTSKYLLKRLAKGQTPEGLHEKLMSLLALKARAGMAEFMSAVYLPYSLGALLNLYDFAEDAQMKQYCEDIVHKVALQVAHVMLEDGSFVSPCGRTYKKFLTRTYGHHLQEFIAFIADFPVEQVGLVNGKRSSFLREIINTTTYRPDVLFYRAVTKIYGVQITLDVSPSRSDVMQLASEWIQKGYRVHEVMCLLWSHGLYAPPGKIKLLKQFVNECKLWAHPHFRAVQSLVWMISSAPSSWIRSLATSAFVEYYRKGSDLTGAKLTVYREPGVLLASLVGYNHGFAAFQQWPWVVNLAGTPVWATLQKKEKGASDNPAADGPKDMQEITTALHRSRGLAKGFPVITQVDNVLRADYSVPLERNKNHQLRMYWPVDEFDQQDTVVFQNGGKRRQVWRYGIKNNAAVAFHIHQPRHVVYVVVKNLLTEHEHPSNGEAEISHLHHEQHEQQPQLFASPVSVEACSSPTSTTSTTTTASTDVETTARCSADLLHERLSEFLCSLPQIITVFPDES